MISSLLGKLSLVEESRVHLQVGPFLLELLTPACDFNELQALRGDDVTLHTVFYIGGDPSRGALEPTLIGFLRAADREFFNLFTTVKGIGSKTALRALAAPVGEIARAIEKKDTRFLVNLNGVGKRTAELIVAELSGKVTRFALAADRAKSTPAIARHNPTEEDAIAALMALGERRPDAERLLDRAKQTHDKAVSTDQLLREMLRLRAS